MDSTLAITLYNNKNEAIISKKLDEIDLYFNSDDMKAITKPHSFVDRCEQLRQCIYYKYGPPDYDTNAGDYMVGIFQDFIEKFINAHPSFTPRLEKVT